MVKIKPCSDCGIEKPLTEFYSQKKHSKKRGDWIYYHPECKECTKDRFYKWIENNPERHKELVQKDNNNISEHTRRLRRKLAKQQRLDGKQKEWMRNNPEKLRVYRLKRYHKKHDITSEEWVTCKKYFNDTCAYCGLSLKEHYNTVGTDFHQEHVDHFGSNDLSNCVPACKNCNSSKWEFEFEDWYSESNLVYAQERYDKIVQWITEDYFLALKN
jgi:hypothetical protein